MFNAPRPTQAYGISSTVSFGGSFVDENPLAASTYDGLDPWSTAPTPSPPPVPSIFTNAIAEATVPAIYQQSWNTVDPTNSGETSVNSLSRVLSTSSLPAATVDKIVNLVSTRPRVSKLEFFVALALVALAQTGKDVSVEQVALLAQQNTLPEPALDIGLVSYSTVPSSTLGYGHTNNGSAALQNTSASVIPSAEDPWVTGRFVGGSGNGSGSGGISSIGVGGAGAHHGGDPNGGVPSSVAGTGLLSGWWKRQERVSIQFAGQQGFVLNRYTVYGITTERGGTVQRRYSEFAFLWDCLVRRYPFRLLLQLPPKRIGPDESFLEQRRKGLERFILFVINHPVIKEDALLGSFLTEPSFEQWRKHSAISLEEESTSKRIDRVEEMTIPSDLEDKLGLVRNKIAPLIEAWQKICILGERLIRKREAAAVRSTSTRPSLMPHLRLPSALRMSSSPSHYSNDVGPIRMPLGLPPMSFRDPALSLLLPSTAQADLSRLTNTLKSLSEVNGQCWKGDDCDLSQGVKQGINNLSVHTQRHTDLLELRSGVLMQDTLEGLKSQRDLYIAMRDLFARHDRLSVDQVERLKKRVDTNALKLETVKAVAKDGWEEEADKIAGSIEKDKATITAQLNRRVFIRACMWHELRVVLHNRENTLLTQLVQSFAREERDYADAVAANWAALVQAVESMPFE
ncbi:hypothetical protein B0F90DRAFT_1751359 [Multifurca ochricompacta]|uniref:Sorting nexin MVP1 n=1 Tax=Multifurca ochricompacta TaxID=376703 RepID=A0AAD4LYF5_9AGAM|nr:hypothetical protein B0F90DRAFT_1751359 [Multifurca ochricompacta]